jgi:WD40 repeat protein
MKELSKCISWCLLFSFLFAVSACTPGVNPIQTPTMTSVAIIQPSETPLPTIAPTAIPLVAQFITSSNAGLLRSVGEIKFQQPTNLIWANSSQAFWVINNANATRYNSKTLALEFPFDAVSPGQILDASTDGDSVAYIAENQDEIRIFNQSQNKTLVFNPGYPFGNVTFSPDGTKLAVTSMDELLVTLWDTNTGSKISTLKGFETAAPVYDAQIGADDQTLIWHSRGTIQLQDLNSQQMGPIFSHEDFVMGLALSRDGNILASAAGGTLNGNYTPIIYIWDAHNGNNLTKLPYPDSFSTLSFSTDGKILASASAGNLILWDMTTYKVITIIQIQSNSISNIAFSPDGKSLLACSSEDNLVKLWQILQ